VAEVGRSDGIRSIVNKEEQKKKKIWNTRENEYFGKEKYDLDGDSGTRERTHSLDGDCLLRFGNLIMAGGDIHTHEIRSTFQPVGLLWVGVMGIKRFAQVAHG